MTWLAGLLTSGWARLIPWIVGTLALLAAWAYVHHQSAIITSLRASLTQEGANRATAENAAHADAAALDEATRQHAVDLAALDVHYTQLAHIDSFKLIALERINDAPETDNGPVAGVLRDAINGLCHAPRNAAGTCGADRQGRAPAGPAVMPAKP